REVAKIKFRVYLERSDELQITARFHALRLDTWLAGRLHFLLVQGLVVALAHDFAEYFLAHTFAVALLDYLDGNLTLPETLDVHRTRCFLQAVPDLVFDQFSRNFDGHFAFQFGQGFNRDLHLEFLVGAWLRERKPDAVNRVCKIPGFSSLGMV